MKFKNEIKNARNVVKNLNSQNVKTFASLFDFLDQLSENKLVSGFINDVITDGFKKALDNFKFKIKNIFNVKKLSYECIETDIGKATLNVRTQKDIVTLAMILEGMLVMLIYFGESYLILKLGAIAFNWGLKLILLKQEATVIYNFVTLCDYYYDYYLEEQYKHFSPFKVIQWQIGEISGTLVDKETEKPVAFINHK